VTQKNDERKHDISNEMIPIETWEHIKKTLIKFMNDIEERIMPRRANPQVESEREIFMYLQGIHYGHLYLQQRLTKHLDAIIDSIKQHPPKGDPK